MIYYENDDILIRNMEKTDSKIICQAEIAQGWNQSEEKYNQRLLDSESGKCISLVAEYKGNIAGYINVYFKAQAGPFINTNYCEIVDFGVLEKYRCNGIGTRLMDVAEDIARNYSETVSLGVGLHNGYGSAQIMYVKRGYIPDGTGVWHGNQIAKPYKNYCNDDELILYFSKQLARI